MPDPTPRKVDKKDYAWCPTCNVYVPKKFLRERDGIFDDEKGQRCPEGHAVELEEVKSA